MRAHMKIAVAGATGRVGRHVVDVLKAGGHAAVAAARNLHNAGERAGVRRMVEVSIIGIDRFTAGYGAAKVAHERAMLSGPIPVRILRAAQFYEFVTQIVEWGRRGEVSYVPKIRVQPVAARTVAQGLADLATAPNRRSHQDRAGHRSRRLPVRRRRTSSTWRDCSRPGAVTRCASRA